MSRYYIVCGILSMVLLAMLQCQDPELTFATTDEVVMTDYFKKNPERFSKFSEILELSGSSSFLGAYGIYTCFAPTNDAVQKYMDNMGVTSLSEIEQNKLKDFVRFHVIKDTISTSRFTDGKLEVPTMYGQYLVTGAININGTSYKRVNRQANIIESNIRVNNGVVHVISDVLSPASSTLAQLIEQNSDYTIFSEVLKATGFYNFLNTVEKDKDGNIKFYTLIAQKDEVFKSAGFNTFEDVKKRYSHTGDPTNSQDSLYLFAAYRIVQSIKYLADLVTAPSHSTLAPQEVITTRLEGTNVLINSDLYLGVWEPGSMVNRAESDFSATNGVLHSVLADYSVKIRFPYPVYFDVADQPEIRRMINIFRKPGAPVQTFNIGDLKDVTWEGAGSTIRYEVGNPSGGQPDPSYAYLDRFYIPQFRSTVGTRKIDFTTPLLVKGKYKVWIAYRVVAINDYQVFFDDEPLPTIFGGNVGYPKDSPEQVALSQGWKIYQLPTAGVWPTASGAGNNYNLAARMVGVVDVKTTDRHKLTLKAITSKNGGGYRQDLWLDMIQFIPLDQVDQGWPKFYTPVGGPNEGILIDHWPL